MDLARIEEELADKLDIDKGLCKAYVMLLINGKAKAEELDIDDDIFKRLIDYGACIEINGYYQALNPRFAITNMYRMQCLKKGINVKRDKDIDRLATILEGLVERVNK